ncbi:hypothetical protein D3C85_1810650 [compost metagenome]
MPPEGKVPEPQIAFPRFTLVILISYGAAATILKFNPEPTTAFHCAMAEVISAFILAIEGSTNTLIFAAFAGLTRVPV